MKSLLEMELLWDLKELWEHMGDNLEKLTSSQEI